MDTGWAWPVFCLPALSPETLSPWLIGAGSPLGVQRGWERRFLQTQPPSAHRDRARAVEVNLGLERDRSVWSGSRGRGATSLKSGGPEAADASPPPPPPSSSRSSTDRARPTTSGGHPLTWETPSRQCLVGCWTETWAPWPGLPDTQSSLEVAQNGARGLTCRLRGSLSGVGASLPASLPGLSSTAPHFPMSQGLRRVISGRIS